MAKPVLKFIQWFSVLRIIKMILKIKKKVRRLIFPKFKTYYKETVTKKKEKIVVLA